jgi:putative spermidine/putrescine transport system permease protein
VSGTIVGATGDQALAVRDKRSLGSKVLDGNGLVALLTGPVLFLLLLLVLPLLSIGWTAIDSKGVSGALATVRKAIFLDTLGRTAVMAAVVTAACLVFGSVYALAMAVSGRPVRLALSACLLLSFWVSILVRSYGWVLILQPGGALNAALRPLHIVTDFYQTDIGMYPAMVNVMLPYMVLPIYASLMAIKPQTLRAAQVSAASPSLVLRRIVLPQLAPGMLAGAMVVFIISLGFFVTPAFIGGPANMTVAMLIERQFRAVYDFGGAAAMGAVVLSATLAAYILADRFLNLGALWTEI